MMSNFVNTIDVLGDEIVATAYGTITGELDATKI